MKKSLILFVFILLVQTALADNEIFSGKIYDAESTTAEDKTLSVKSGKGITLVTFGKEEFLVALNKCEDFNEYEICLNNIEPEIFSEITLSKKEIELKFEKTKDRTDDIKVGEPVIITLSVENIGGIQTKFTAYDDIEGLSITNIDNICKQINSTTIIFDYAVNANSKTKCEYRALVIKEIEEKEAILYYYSNNILEKLESEIEFEIKKTGLTFELDFDEKKIYDLYSKIPVTLKIKNFYDEIAIVENLELTSEGLDVMEKNNKLQKKKFFLQLGIELELEPNAEVEYEIFYNITNFNPRLILNTFFLTPKGKEKKLLIEEVKVKTLEPQISIEKVTDVYFRVHIVNNGMVPLKNVNLNLKSNFQNINVDNSFPEIRPVSEKIIELKLEEVKEKPTIVYPLFATARYDVASEKGLRHDQTMPIDVRERIAQPQITNLNETNSTSKELEKSITGFGMIIPVLIAIILIIGITFYFWRKTKIFLEKNKNKL